MKSITKHLEKLRKIKKKNYHHLQYKIHKKHNISKKTLFYVKEYGPNANVTKTIFKESNTPTCEDHFPKCNILEFEMPVPRECHENV